MTSRAITGTVSGQILMAAGSGSAARVRSRPGCRSRDRAANLGRPRYRRSRSSVDADSENALNLAAAPDGKLAAGGRPGRLRAARQPARV